MGLWHTIKFSQMPLRLVPKILDAIDMIFSIRKGLKILSIDAILCTDYGCGQNPESVIFPTT